MFRKRLLKSCILAILVALCWSLTTCNKVSQTTHRTSPDDILILISLDGFRWDYIERTDTPNLDFLIESGVHTEALVPIFPSKTFPNHYTIVTGLFAENHGIVANTMYDPVFDAPFSLGNQEAVRDGRWYEGEPIWVTAEKQGLVTACYFWPGSEAEIGAERPTYWVAFDDDTPNSVRVSSVLEFIDMTGENRPAFYTLYFSDLDDAGHEFGPDSKGIQPAIREIDTRIGQLLTGLRERNILDTVNILVVSDHGMSQLSTERIIYLDDYLEPDSLNVINISPNLDIWLPEEDADSVFDLLDEAHPHFKVYKKEDIPKYLHYSSHRRVPPVVGIVDDGWSLTTHEVFKSDSEDYNGGTHGFDPIHRSMHGIFIARGPAFKAGVTIPPVRNIHLYSLMAEVLGLEPASNDGSIDSIRQVLAE